MNNIIDRMKNEIISMLTIGMVDKNKTAFTNEQINNVLQDNELLIHENALEMYNVYKDEINNTYQWNGENDWYREYMDEIIEKIDNF